MREHTINNGKLRINANSSFFFSHSLTSTQKKIKTDYREKKTTQGDPESLRQQSFAGTLL